MRISQATFVIALAAYGTAVLGARTRKERR